MRSTLAVVGVAAITGLTGCGTATVTAGAGAPSPRVLHLAPSVGLGAPAAAPAGRAGRSEYVLVGRLPVGPGRAAAFDLPTGAVPELVVQRLGQALGLTSTPSRQAGGWLLAQHGFRLVVADAAGGPWSFGGGACPPTLATGAPFVACAVGTAVGTVRPGGPPSLPRPLPTPSEATVRALATRLLDALGAQAATVQVLGGELTVPIAVAGSATAGYSLTANVAADGQPQAANGWAGTPVRADNYPLISAAAAFAKLPPRVLPMFACLAPPRGRPCPTLGPALVTGAQLGLTLAYDRERPMLVPAWLFSIRGQADPVPVIAITPAFLAPPGPPPLVRNPVGGGSPPMGSPVEVPPATPAAR